MNKLQCLYHSSSAIREADLGNLALPLDIIKGNVHRNNFVDNIIITIMVHCCYYYTCNIDDLSVDIACR